MLDPSQIAISMVAGIFGVAAIWIGSHSLGPPAIRDPGSLVGTHGSVLDGYDSLIFVPPMFLAWRAR